MSNNLKRNRINKTKGKYSFTSDQLTEIKNEIIKNKDENSKSLIQKTAQKKEKKWTNKEETNLKNLLVLYNSTDFESISKNMHGITPEQCSEKWKKIALVEYSKGRWSPEEDKLLTEWVEKHGPNKWTLCSKTIPGRNGKQCREHWSNSLDPNLKKGEWSLEEDYLLYTLYNEYGGSWKKIAPLFNGRTENTIKNRFCSQLRKASLKCQKHNELNTLTNKTETGKDVVISRKKLARFKKYTTQKNKLNNLLNYLPSLINETKRDIINLKKMTENQLDEYVNSQELKLKNMDGAIDNNLGEEIDDKDEKKEFLEKKRKRSKILIKINEKHDNIQENIINNEKIINNKNIINPNNLENEFTICLNENKGENERMKLKGKFNNLVPNKAESFKLSLGNKKNVKNESLLIMNNCFNFSNKSSLHYLITQIMLAKNTIINKNLFSKCDNIDSIKQKTLKIYRIMRTLEGLYLLLIKTNRKLDNIYHFLSITQESLDELI